MSKWTVTPEVVRYELSLDGDGFWIEVKKELTAGERSRIRVAGIRSYSHKPAEVVDEVTSNVDLDAATFEKVRIWLADWSLTDDKGNKLKLNSDTLHALRTDVYDVIDRQVEAHAKGVADLSKKSEPTETATGTSGPKRIS